MLTRYYDDLEQYVQQGKVLVIYGARRVGKTTLLSKYLNNCSHKYKLVSGDNIKVREVFNSGDQDTILEFCQGYELLAIDEAQTINNIGLGLKIIVDNMPNLRVIATGSSSFDIVNKVGEPLVGRKKTLTMFPLSQLELANCLNKYEIKDKLNSLLRFGSYPESYNLTNVSDKIEYLYEIAGSYLYKDILAFGDIKNSNIIHKLLKMLAFQVGSEVSSHDLSKEVGIDIKTVAKYLDLLEKTFIICKLHAFSRNLRKEINKKHKYYFLDLGIRNAVISNFNDIDSRSDLGALWENFLFVERQKRNSYQRHHANAYFWRTYDKKEVDYIEESGGSLDAFEFKWKHSNKHHLKSFQQTYPEAKTTLVSRDNYLDFVL